MGYGPDMSELKSEKRYPCCGHCGHNLKAGHGDKCFCQKEDDAVEC